MTSDVELPKEMGGKRWAEAFLKKEGGRNVVQSKNVFRENDLEEQAS